jgi:hypothetical protein
VIVPLVLATATAASAPPADVSFDRATARSGDLVAVRLERLRRPVRVYLVPRGARRVRSATDARLHYVGFARPVRGRATLSFQAPPLNGSYAAWCVGCRAGRTLRLSLPAATPETCPVTLPRATAPPGLDSGWGPYQGNGALWGQSPESGVWSPPADRVQPDGSVGTKLFWWAAGVDGVFTLVGRRLDASTRPLLVHAVNRGSQPGFRGSATWATPVTFPSGGCWRLTARVVDTNLRFAVNLAYVLEVAAR